MIRRGPVLPSRRLFAWLAGLILGSVSVASALVALQNHAVPPWMAVALPISTSLTGMGLIMGALELLKRLEEAGWRPSEPKLRNWALYLSCFGLAGLVIGGLRGAMMLIIEGSFASVWPVYAELGLCLYGSLLVAIVMDLQTQYERRALVKRTESLLAVHTIFESQEAWIEARNRRRKELHRIVNERVEPELAAVHAALSSAGRAELSEETLGTLCDRLDHLRDDEIRHLSHLTHPSIIDIGLHAALRGLVRRYRDRFTVTLDADPMLMEQLTGTLRLTIYRIVELLLELAAANAAQPVTVGLHRQGAAILLKVIGAKESFDFARARRDGQLALLEARAAILDGAWQIQDDPDTSGIRVLLSESAGTQSLSQRRN